MLNSSNAARTAEANWHEPDEIDLIEGAPPANCMVPLNRARKIPMPDTGSVGPVLQPLWNVAAPGKDCGCPTAKVVCQAAVCPRRDEVMI